MKGKTLLIVVLSLVLFALQGCNGPDGGGREAPYSTSHGPQDVDGDDLGDPWMATQPRERERPEMAAPGS